AVAMALGTLRVPGAGVAQARSGPAGGEPLAAGAGPQLVAEHGARTGLGADRAVDVGSDLAPHEEVRVGPGAAHVGREAEDATGAAGRRRDHLHLLQADLDAVR